MMFEFWKAFVSGVTHDDEAIRSSSNGFYGGVDPHVRDRIILNRAHHCGAASTLKGADEHRGQVIDFSTAADRIRMRRWAVANGFARVQVKP